MVKKYLPAQILLHWLVLGFVALQYLLHEPISESFEKRLEGVEGQLRASLHCIFLEEA
ncbi:MAG: hypothetical protein ACPGOW_11010 [Paracoccaceae bacterium]